jgi:carboxylate-amine ligase
VYGYNRFQACRFGFDAALVDPDGRRHVTLRDDLLEVLERLEPRAAELGTAIPLLTLASAAARSLNDSRWLRERLEETKSLPDVVRMQAARWRDEPKGLSRGSSAPADRART